MNTRCLELVPAHACIHANSLAPFFDLPDTTQSAILYCIPGALFDTLVDTQDALFGILLNILGNVCDMHRTT
jgi:hypothetical protein